MATAVETSSQPKTPNPPANLLFASAIGTLYVVAALAVIFYAVPQTWAEFVTPKLNNNLLDYTLWGLVEVAIAVVLAWFGSKLAGANPPKGLRGGVFLMLVTALVVFFLVRGVGLAFDGVAGQIGMGIILIAMIFGAFRLFTSPRGEQWMVGLEEQGWFHATTYKRALGQRVRRLTILGLLLIGGSGVYSLYNQQMLPQDWTMKMPAGIPFVPETIAVLHGANYAVPLLLMGLTLWIAYRAVNMPTFAEFLIATEAEMNKVSWTTRRRLMQDTAVVLITTFLLTLFLFGVDMFWGWLLSRSTVGVLPGRGTGQDKAGQVHEQKW